MFPDDDAKSTLAKEGRYGMLEVVQTDYPGNGTMRKIYQDPDGAFYAFDMFTDGQSAWTFGEVFEVFPLEERRTTYVIRNPDFHYREPWSIKWDGDPGDGSYMGVGTAGTDPNVTCWEDEPSEQAMRLEARLVECVNFCAGVQSGKMAEYGSLRSLINGK